MLGNEKKAIEVWESIIDMGIERVGLTETKEGLDWAGSLITDCHFRIGSTLFDLKKYQESINHIIEYNISRSKFNSLYSIEDAKKIYDAIISILPESKIVSNITFDDKE